MPQHDPTEIMIRHNDWATTQLLDACNNLSDDQLDHPFDMGVGTLRKTITHTLGAQRGWGDLLAGRPQRERLEAQGPHSIAQLRDLHHDISTDFAASVRAHPANDIARGERNARTYAFTRGQVATHVYTHAMHHRAQCLNMLHHLGIDPLPPSAVVEWCFMEDPVE